MSIVVKTLPVGQLQANCYIVVDEETDKGIVIDPGDDGEYIIQKIMDERIELESIVATHGHFDHVLAVNELKLAFNVPFLMHRNDEFLLKRMRETAKHYAGFDPGPEPKVDEYLNAGSGFGFGEVTFELLSLPGHTPGSMGLYAADQNVLFVGDVVFANGAVGRTDFAYCSKTDLLESIRRILALPDQTLVYPGHDRSFYVADERINHPYFKLS